MTSKNIKLLLNKKNKPNKYELYWLNLGNIIKSKKKLDIIDITFNSDGLPSENNVVYNGKIFKNVDFNKQKEVWLKYYDILNKSLKEDAYDLVIELGSGWGRNIFYLIQSNSLKDIKIISGEYTNSGCDIQKYIQKTFFNKIDIDIHKFDYNNSTNFFNTIKEKYGKINKCFVFTKHSIEQISEIKNDFFDNLLNISNSLKCIHFEPVGWQIGESVSFLSTGNLSYYNKNLYSKLKEYETKNLIKINDIKIDILGTGRIGNTSTFIEWEKI